MTIVRHELKRGFVSFAVWTVAIVFLVAICIFLFPEMSGQMEGVNDLFASLGAFSTAFGMDRLSIGTLTGFYSVECGNLLGLGGGFFAALTAVTMLAKEEKDRTSEFLLTHPITRTRIITEKLIALIIEITMMNIIVYAVSVISIYMIGEAMPWKEITLIHIAYYIMQLEIAGICFGISAFIRKNGAGIGLGLATIAYFINIIANMTEKADFLKYITPFGYCDGADIVLNGSLDTALIIIALIITVIGIAIAYIRYTRKDVY